MAVLQYDIKPGVRLNFIETDKFKTNFLSVNYLTPLSEKDASMKALLPMVLKRGTQSYPDITSLSKRSDMLYATYIGYYNYKRGETQIFGFASNMLANRYVKDGTDILGGALDLFEEVMFKPVLENGVFKSDYVESEKNNLADGIRAKINNKNSYAIKRCQEEMCRGETYAVQDTGTVEDVCAITPQSLYEFYLDVINRARIEIFFVGMCDINSLVDSLRKLFSPINHVEGFIPYTNVIRKADKIREITEEQPVSQGKLSMGFRTNTVLADGDYHKFIVFAEIFGSSPSSKLFMNVREKLSLCYYCSLLPEPQKGIMIIASGIEVENKQKAQDEILVQLEAMRNGEFTDEEINSAKISIINDYRSIGDSAGAMDSWYIGRMLAGLNNTPEEASELLESVTREDIINAAKNISLDMIYFMKGTLVSNQAEEEGDENDE